MESNETVRIAQEFEELVHDISSKNAGEQSLAVRNWFKAVSVEYKDYALTLVNIYKARSQVVINTGSIFDQRGSDMSDKSTNVKVAGDMNQSAVGVGAQLTAQSIQNVKDSVNTSAVFDAPAQQLFKAVVDEIVDKGFSDEIRAEIFDELEKLRKQIDANGTSPGLLKKSWNAIVGLAGALPKLMEFGKWIAGRFPQIPGITM